VIDAGAEVNGGEAWEAFQATRHRLEPPLCPTPGVIAAMRDAVGSPALPILLLGVTPAIVAAFDNLVVIDWSAAARGAVADAKPLDGNWLDPRLDESSLGGALGDGSLTCLSWPDDYALLFATLARLLAPGARAAIRCYAAPERRDVPDALVAEALSGRGGGFAAFKWRLAMTLALDPNVPVAAIKQSFDALIPDRNALAAATGWTPAAIDDVDAYGHVGLTYSFPTRRQLLACARPFFVAAEFVETEGYELAERCPLLILKRGY